MPRQSDAKERMIGAAAKLFKLRGYNGTGLTEILSESGAPKGSFYHHFPDGKEQLAEAVVLQEGAAITALIEKAFANSETFDDGAATMSGYIAKWFAKSGYAEGCPITAVLLVTVPASERLHTACRTVLADWSTVVEEAAKANGLANKAELLGEAMVLSIEGAWVLSRAVQTTSPFDTATRLIQSLADTR